MDIIATTFGYHSNEFRQRFHRNKRKLFVL